MAKLATHLENASIVECYTLTNDYNNIDIDVFYEQISDVVNRVPHHDILLIMGDMNAQIGGSRSRYEHVHRLHAFGKWADEGERFMNDIVIRMSLFDHEDIHRIMWNSNDHCTYTQINHIAIGARLRIPCLQDVRVFRGEDAFSEHQLVVVKIKETFK